MKTWLNAVNKIHDQELYWGNQFGSFLMFHPNVFLFKKSLETFQDRHLNGSGSINKGEAVEGPGPGRLSSSSAGLFSLDVSLTKQPIRGHLPFALDGDVAPQLQLETLKVLQNLVSCCRHVNL